MSEPSKVWRVSLGERIMTDSLDSTSPDKMKEYKRFLRKNFLKSLHPYYCSRNEKCNMSLSLQCQLFHIFEEIKDFNHTYVKFGNFEIFFDDPDFDWKMKVWHGNRPYGDSVVSVTRKDGAEVKYHPNRRLAMKIRETVDTFLSLEQNEKERIHCEILDGIYKDLKLRAL